MQCDEVWPATVDSIDTIATVLSPKVDFSYLKCPVYFYITDGSRVPCCGGGTDDYWAFLMILRLAVCSQLSSTSRRLAQLPHSINKACVELDRIPAHCLSASPLENYPLLLLLPSPWRVPCASCSQNAAPVCRGNTCQHGYVLFSFLFPSYFRTR